MKYYVCKTVRLLNYLSKKFDVVKIDKDRNNPNFVIFLFEDTLEFREYLNKYNK
nr:MAG TPA: hypothetical protein [Caudoviricetes sp.]